MLAQALMEAEVSPRSAPTAASVRRRGAQRNGDRDRDWDTRVGAVELVIPKLRTGSYFPSIMDARRRAEQAPCGVVAQCYVKGVDPAGG